MNDEIDRLFANAADKYDSVRTNPVTGARWVPSLDPVKTQKQNARRALAARAAFERVRPNDAPPLPLSYAEREALKGRFDIRHMEAHYARSWEASDYSEDHPSFDEYAAGVLALSSPGIRYNELTPSLAVRFPPRPCPGLGVSTIVNVGIYCCAKPGYPAR